MWRRGWLDVVVGLVGLVGVVGMVGLVGLGVDLTGSSTWFITTVGTTSSSWYTDAMLPSSVRQRNGAAEIDDADGANDHTLGSKDFR